MVVCSFDKESHPDQPEDESGETEEGDGGFDGCSSHSLNLDVETDRSAVVGCVVPAFEDG